MTTRLFGKLLVVFLTLAVGVEASAKKAGGEPMKRKLKTVKSISSTLIIGYGEVKKIEGTQWSIKLISESFSYEDAEGNHSVYGGPALQLLGPKNSHQNRTKEVLLDPVTEEKSTVTVGGKDLFPEKIEYTGPDLKSVTLKVTNTPIQSGELEAD